VVNWTNFKAITEQDPLKALERRNPLFYKRYVGKSDRYGFDLKSYATYEPFFRFLYEDYFNVEVRGLENIPSEGRAILVGNHSGTLPIDAGMISIAIGNEHPSPRRVRYLVTDWFFQLPVLGPWMLTTGQVRGTLEIAKNLLEEDELIGIYPEGVRGVGKVWRDRYRVIDFHPGFVKLAIATQTPLIPVATVGGDEVFPMILNARKLAQFMRMPYFPVTTAFPWLPFPWPLIPLPIHWMINIHKPIDLGYPAEKATDRKLVQKICKEIQYTIQRDLNNLFEERKTLFTGWDETTENKDGDV
jgi:1-acyl-sn-glycerol-3-phosphate acyltransferase